MGNYNIMDEKLIVDYIKSLDIEIFQESSKLIAKEIGDGNLNYVFRIKDEDTKKSFIVKQALPYLKIAGEGWKLPLDRNRIEAEAMKEQDRACCKMVPKVYYSSKDKALFIAEDLGHMDTLRNAYMKMKTYPNFPKFIGEFLGKNLYYTSDIGLEARDKKNKSQLFNNPELCDITERLVLTDPYRESESNDINPEIIDNVKEIWKDEKVLLETAKLKNIFMTKHEALIHGDLHTGSIFIDENAIKVFDSEFAFYGPYGYDIGLLFANFILNYVSWEGIYIYSEEQVSDFREYILKSIEEIWNSFEKTFSGLWGESFEVTTKSKGYYDCYMKSLFSETIGFCGCEIIRRVVGMAHVPDLDRISNLKDKAKAEKKALNIGQKLITKREDFLGIEDLTTLIEIL